MEENSSKLWLAGIDEAGRGPLAGPVTAACVCLPTNYRNSSITDSKLLKESQREALFEEITRIALSYSVVSVGQCRIDELNILQATKRAMQLAARRVRSDLLRKFSNGKMYLLIDGNARIDNSFVHETIIKGDQKFQSIAAASIIAKVTRDRLMLLLDERYPSYGFRKHKGYPTKSHQAAIREIGPSRVHRETFSGVRDVSQTDLFVVR